MDKLIALLTALIKDKFYGEIVLKFEAGNVTVIKKNQTIKL